MGPRSYTDALGLAKTSLRSKGVAVIVTSATGLLAAAATRSIKTLWAVVKEIFFASCPSAAQERSVPTARSLGPRAGCFETRRIPAKHHQKKLRRSSNEGEFIRILLEKHGVDPSGQLDRLRNATLILREHRGHARKPFSLGSTISHRINQGVEVAAGRFRASDPNGLEIFQAF